MQESPSRKRRVWALALACVAIGVLGLAILLPSYYRTSAPPPAVVIGDFRAAAPAMALYATENGGFFDGRFECLSRPWDGCIPGYDESRPIFLGEEVTRLGERHGYTRTFHPGPKADPEAIREKGASPTSVVSWVLIGAPADDASQMTTYCVDSEGVLCRLPGPPKAPFADHRCPPGCADLE